MRENLHVRATAEQYDAYTAEAVEAWDSLLMARLAAEKRRRAPGGRLLDIGTGTAVLPVKLCGVDWADDLELIATDYFEDMLEAARARVERAGVAARIRIERQDVHALSYPDRAIRYVISRSTLHHWADPVAALREIHRVLEPDGVVLIHDVRRDAPVEIVRLLDERRRSVGIGPMLLEEKYTVDEVRRICERAGLQQVARVRTAASGPGALGFELRIAGRPDSL